jgi:hypothetical protein
VSSVYFAFLKLGASDFRVLWVVQSYLVNLEIVRFI